MDGVERIDADEMPILPTGKLIPPVSLCRGRFSRPDTLSKASFTGKQLDAVVPLSRTDILSLRLNKPSARTKEKMRRRIEAACDLKYRGNDDVE